MTTRDRDLSAEARSAKVDDAIDQVAARMTAVHEDADLTSRIVAALPERSMFGGWLFQSWAPRLAAIALFAIGAALWNQNGVQRSDPSRVTQPATAPSGLVAFAPVVSPVRPTIPGNREPGAGSRTAPVAVDVPDHERSLPAIEAMTALGMSSLAPRDLPASESLALSPIDIADLPMTAETFSPRDF